MKKVNISPRSRQREARNAYMVEKKELVNRERERMKINKSRRRQHELQQIRMATNEAYKKAFDGLNNEFSNVSWAKATVQDQHGLLRATQPIQIEYEKFKNFSEVAPYSASLHPILASYRIAPDRAEYLVGNYGKQASLILSALPEFQNEDPEITLARAELDFGIKNEAVASADDFFVRRTGRLFFDIPSIPGVRKAIMDDLHTAFSWTESRRQEEEERLDVALADAATFYEL